MERQPAGAPVAPASQLSSWLGDVAAAIYTLVSDGTAVASDGTTVPNGQGFGRILFDPAHPYALASGVSLQIETVFLQGGGAYHVVQAAAPTPVDPVSVPAVVELAAALGLSPAQMANAIISASASAPNTDPGPVGTSSSERASAAPAIKK